MSNTISRWSMQVVMVIFQQDIRIVTRMVQNYVYMRQRVSRLERIDNVTGSSNFGKFIKLFEARYL